MTDTFNLENYPDFALCKAMPEFKNGITEIQIDDLSENQILFDVPTIAVTRLFLVACRILDSKEDLYSIEIPAIPEPVIIEIPFTGIARPRRPRS